MIAKRVRARQQGVKGYINAMRPGWLGNPFPISEYSLEESLKQYEDYLREKLKESQFAKRFDSLVGKDIGCTCPLDQSCHVDIIIKILGERQFKEDCQLQNLADRTISNYLYELKKIPANTEAQRQYLIDNRGNRDLIFAYRKYLKFQRKIGIISSEELEIQLDTFRPPKVRGNKQNGMWFSREQWEELIVNAPHRSAKMAIWIGLNFGLRPGEIFNLRVQDVDLDNNLIHIQVRKDWHPKYNRNRSIPIPPEGNPHGIKETLVRWIKERPNLDHPYLVYTTRNEQVTSRIFNYWCKKAHPKLKPHDLRRSFAQVCYNKKKNLKLVQEILGHSNIGTTSRYLSLNPEEIAKEFTETMG